MASIGLDLPWRRRACRFGRSTSITAAPRRAGSGLGRPVGAGAFHPDPCQRPEPDQPGVQLGEPVRRRRERLDCRRNGPVPDGDRPPSAWPRGTSSTKWFYGWADEPIALRGVGDVQAVA